MTEISRRALLAGATATAATAVFGSMLISPSSLVAQPSPIVAGSPNEDTFIELSAALTGIDKDLLSPGVDPFRLRDAVFDRANQANNDPKDAEILAKLLAKFEEAKNANAQGSAMDPVKKLYEDAEKPENKVEYEPMKFLMRSIILAWYLGAWYKPQELKNKSYAAKNPQRGYYSTRRYSAEVLIPYEVISPNAYTNGMVWRVAQAHPMGYSNLQFGYWSKEPPDQDMFTKPLKPDSPDADLKTVGSAKADSK
jgi:hypothetical protein